MADTNTKYNFLDYEGLALFWNNVKNIIDTDKIETNNAITNLDTRVDTVEGALANQIISITYTELKTLRDAGQLVPGQQYRITDYTCTTTTAGTTSAGHVFDIIVTADDENTLNEVARAIQHEGDTYFANCDLNAWKIWYCLDNDTNRFAWADETNGKGVIYRMIDDWNNDVPYDFKNIQFYRQWDSSKSLWSTISSDNTGVPCYTFSSEGNSSTTSFTDMSLDASNSVYSNVIKGNISSGKQFLNNNCFFGNNCYSNTFDSDCYSNTFGNSCYSNSFGNKCYGNTFGNSCYRNTFGNSCYSNIFKGMCRQNTFGNAFCINSCNGVFLNNSFGDDCHDNTFGSRYNYNSVGSDCYSNSFGSDCYSNSFGSDCYSNSFGNNCNYNSFGNICCNNSFMSSCQSNSFGNKCCNNSFGGSCQSNTFGNNCHNNTFGNECYGNTFGNSCHDNTFGSGCSYNTFRNECSYDSFRNNCEINTFGNNCWYDSFGNDCDSNSFGNYCNSNSFGNYCSSNTFGNKCCNNSLGISNSRNSFGNDCSYNSFRLSPSTTSTLKNYVQYNHFDDGCAYNVIWNSYTTSSTVLLKNINVNRGVVGTSSSYNMININTVNSEQEINVNQVDGIVSIGNILSIKYESLKTIRDSSKLIPGQQYRIIDYITTTTQENVRSAWHQFDIIVTALNESTLSEEAQAIQNSNDGYFDGSNLSAWKLWYCLDNDTSRFAWAGDNVKVGEIEHKTYDSSKCTIKPELINGNAFITPFNFESCVWVDGNNDGFAYSDDHINHDISELIYEWGYFTDDNGVKQLCIYKSDADLYTQEGQPDYGDKYLYRGVINVDGTDYDYWQKWDVSSEYGLNVQNSGDYVYATTQRIVSNPEAYSVTTVTEDVYGPGKGVIYRMIDEWNNDVPYDFKNIQFNGVWGYWAYTFNWVNDNSDNTCEDLSVAQYNHTNDEGGYSHTYGNIIKPCEDGSTSEYGYPLKLNNIVFLNTESYDGGNCYGCYSNTLGNNCYSNTLGNECYNNSFGSGCFSNSFGNYCCDNSFGSRYVENSFGNSCSHNTFGNQCSANTFGNNCISNSFGNSCQSNSFGNECYNNSFGNECISNSFGNECYNNSFGNDCDYNSFRVSANNSSSLKNYVQYNHFDDGCSYNVIWNSDTTSSSVLLQNININRGVVGTDSSHNMININTLNQDYEIQVAKNSKGEIKVYCEADLIA